MIEFTTGEVITTGKGTFSIYPFYKKGIKDREQPLWEAEKDDRSGIPKSEKILEVVPSCLAVHKKNWTTRRHNYPEGALIKFVMKRTNPKVKGASAFSQVSMTAMYIRVRETAPLMLIEIDLPFDQNSTKPRLYMNGRFDILTEEQIVRLGLHINGQGSNELHLYEAFDEDPNIFVKQQEKGIAAKAPPKLVKVSSTKSIPKLRRTRRVGLVD